MDAGLAKVVNSTVGTPNFAPLDKLLYGNKALIPSENIYFKIGAFANKTISLSGGTTNTKQFQEETLVTMTMWTDGGFSLSATGTAGHNSSTGVHKAKGGISIYKNGTFLARQTASGFAGQVPGSGTWNIKISNIYFTTGDVIDIKLCCEMEDYDQAYTITSTISNTDPIVIYADAVDKSFDLSYV